MPFRDAAATLAEALASLAAQDLADFELVAVDDGSHDGSSEVLRSRWPAARLALLQPGRVGLVAALNLGLAHCRGELVARMDADDVATADRLRLQSAYLDAHPEVAITGAKVRCFGGAPLGQGYRLYEAWLNELLTHEDIERELFVESPLAHPSVMARRQVLAGLGGYHDRSWPEDYDLWLRAAARGLRFGKVDAVLLHWRDYPERTSRRDARYSQGAFLRCKAHYLARGPLAGRTAVAIWGAGPIGRRLGRSLRAEGVPIAAYVDIDPRKIGRCRGGVPVRSPDELHRLRPDFVVAAVGSRGARAPLHKAPQALVPMLRCPRSRRLSAA